MNYSHVEKILASRICDRAWILWYWLSSTRGRAAATAHVRGESFSLLLVCHVLFVEGRYRMVGIREGPPGSTWKERLALPNFQILEKQEAAEEAELQEDK